MTKALVEELRAKARPLSMRQAEFVEHLLATPGDPEGQDAADCMFRAADHIEAIGSENERLRKALEFARGAVFENEHFVDVAEAIDAALLRSSTEGDR